MALHPLVNLGLFIAEFSRLHLGTLPSVGPLWTSDRPVRDLYLITETGIHAPCGNPIRNP
jgi:hypothetical protein